MKTLFFLFIILTFGFYVLVKGMDNRIENMTVPEARKQFTSCLAEHAKLLYYAEQKVENMSKINDFENLNKLIKANENLFYACRGERVEFLMSLLNEKLSGSKEDLNYVLFDSARIGHLGMVLYILTKGSSHNLNIHRAAGIALLNGYSRIKNYLYLWLKEGFSDTHLETFRPISTIPASSLESIVRDISKVGKKRNRKEDCLEFEKQEQPNKKRKI